jgi:hypothetical protein
MRGDPSTVLPECDRLIAIHFNSLGRCQRSDYGLKEISWVEINSYINANKVELSRFDLLLIREMSLAYISNRSDDNPNKSPPYIRDLTVEEAIAREMVIERMIEEDERKMKSP